VVIAALFLIVASLGSALIFVVRDRSGSTREVELAGTGSAVPHGFHRHLGFCTAENSWCCSRSTGYFGRAMT